MATALTGDPDLYVTVGGSDLPGPNNFYWMGGATGEFCQIDREPVFCLVVCLFEKSASDLRKSVLFEATGCCSFRCPWPKLLRQGTDPCLWR